MNKPLPAALREKQEFQRQQTINKVLHALDYLDSCGMKPTVKNLTECTGLSRSVFAKSHVKEVIDSYRPGNDQPTPQQKKELERREKKQSDIRKLEERVGALTAENAELKHENELLRGKLFLLMNRQQSGK